MIPTGAAILDQAWVPAGRAQAGLARRCLPFLFLCLTSFRRIRGDAGLQRWMAASAPAWLSRSRPLVAADLEGPAPLVSFPSPRRRADEEQFWRTPAAVEPPLLADPAP